MSERIHSLSLSALSLVALLAGTPLYEAEASAAPDAPLRLERRWLIGTVQSARPPTIIN